VTDERTFQLAEYNALRKEVEIYLQESRSQERYTLIAVGAIWAWLVVNHLTSKLLWLIPVLLTAATTLRMGAILLHFGNLKRYISRLESKFESPGWEHVKKGWTLGAAYVVVDVVLLAITIIGLVLRESLAGPTIPPKASIWMR
jgi:hypothetical protein